MRISDWSSDVCSSDLISTSISSNFSRASRAELLAASGDNPATDQRLRWEVDAQHLQPLPWQLQLLTHVNGVYSPAPLVDTDPYSQTGRALCRERVGQ